jgi:hypothetical protein
VHLFIQSDQEIENYIQTTEDHNALPDIIKTLTSKEKLVCLFSEDDFNQSVEKWGAYLQPAHKIKHIDNEYYAVAYN